MEGSAAKAGSNGETGQYLGSVALMHDRGSDHSCPDVSPTPASVEQTCTGGLGKIGTAADGGNDLASSCCLALSGRLDCTCIAGVAGLRVWEPVAGPGRPRRVASPGLFPSGLGSWRVRAAGEVGAGQDQCDAGKRDRLDLLA